MILIDFPNISTPKILLSQWFSFSPDRICDRFLKLPCKMNMATWKRQKEKEKHLQTLNFSQLPQLSIFGLPSLICQYLNMSGVVGIFFHAKTATWTSTFSFHPFRTTVRTSPPSPVVSCLNFTTREQLFIEPTQHTLLDKNAWYTST